MLNVHSTRLNANRHCIIWVKPVRNGLCILTRGELESVSEARCIKSHHCASWITSQCVMIDFCVTCCKCLHTFHVAVVLYVITELTP